MAAAGVLAATVLTVRSRPRGRRLGIALLAVYAVAQTVVALA